MAIVIAPMIQLPGRGARRSPLVLQAIEMSMAALVKRSAALYLTVVAVAAGLYLAGPLNAGPVFNAFGLAAILAIAIGVSLNRPTLRFPWYLFAFGQALFVLGDVLAYNLRLFGADVPAPSIPSPADAFYLGFYPSLVAGLLVLLHRRSPGRDRASLIDSLIVLVSVAAVSWVYLIAPYVPAVGLSLPTKLTSMAYPLMDLLLLGVTVRLAVGPGTRGTAFRLLIIGILALLITDAIYGWKQLHGGYEPGGLLDGGWILFYAAFAAAALHPSMRHLSEPAAAPARGLGRHRLAVLAGATLVAPAILAIRVALGQPVDVPVLAGASAALSLLVVARIGGLMRDQQEAARRETVLREAGEQLVGAGTREGICRAGVSAARSLHPSAREARVQLIDETRDRLGAAERAGAEPEASLLPLFARGTLQGLLVTCAEEPPPRAAQEALNVLASQLALALESISLADESMRMRAEARLSALVRNASDVVSIVARDGTITYTSPSVERVLGYREEALTGARFVEFVHEDDVSALAAFVAAAVERSSVEPASCEFRMRHRDGRWVHVETLATSLLEDSSVGGIVLNTRDVTDRRQAAELERRLQRSQRMESVGQLAGGIAHDFNNLLAVILNYAYLVRQEIADGDQVPAHDIDEISKAGERAAALVRQLLVFSGREVIEPQILDVNDVLADMKTLLASTIGDHIELRLIPGPDLPPVLSDQSQLAQIVMNLAINARDAMPAGGTLTIETRRHHAPADAGIGNGQRIVLRVADTGCGMSEEVAARAFEPFFTTKPKDKGSGLGLATVYGIVAGAGGELELDSVPGLGTVVEVRLPSDRRPVARCALTGGAASRSAEGEETILLVDDEHAVREAIGRILSRHRYEVLIAGSPSEALRVAASHEGSIDLLLTDVVMPEMSGRELAARMREAQPGLAVLYMSGYDDEIVTRHGVREPGTPLLQKPFDTRALLASVREALEKDVREVPPDP